jgi:hypothetical protein
MAVARSQVKRKTALQISAGKKQNSTAALETRGEGGKDQMY